MEFNEPFEMLLAANEIFESDAPALGAVRKKTTPVSRDGFHSSEVVALLNTASGDVSSNADAVGLVEAYANKSADAPHLRKLAAIGASPARQAVPVVLPGRAHRITAAETAAFVEAYRHGGNVREWARDLGVHRSTLHELVRRRGLERLPGTVTPEQRVLADAYKQGATLAELAARYEMGPNRVARTLRAGGVTLRPRGRRSESSVEAVSTTFTASSPHSL